jgi:hypothetical protein
MPRHGFGRCDGHHEMVDFAPTAVGRLLRAPGSKFGPNAVQAD